MNTWVKSALIAAAGGALSALADALAKEGFNDPRHLLEVAAVGAILVLAAYLHPNPTQQKAAE